MAEFVEVMKQARRMCMAQEDCESCPIWDTAKSFCRIGAACYSDDGVTESIVIVWAAKHPEPTYPSWEDGWKQEFPNAIAAPCPKFFYDYTCKQAGDCKKCKLSPMPAEIAEKLGIRPIAPDRFSCNECRYRGKPALEEPCARCRRAEAPGSEGWAEMPDLWEVNPGDD